VNFLGYPGTTGADFIDYIIGDPSFCRSISSRIIPKNRAAA
jgi:hypothetical protein